MPVVHIKIRNKLQSIACGKGEEEHVQSLAASLEKKMEKLALQLNAPSDYTLLLMTALMMEDELSSKKPTTSASSSPESEDKAQKTVTNTLHKTAEYIENIAKNLETL